MKKNFIILLILVSIFLISCSKKSNPSGPGGPSPITKEMIRQGWNYFETKDYPNANLRFDEAIIEGDEEGYIGKGWTLAYQGNYTSSGTNLSVAVSSSQSSSFSDTSRADARAGLALVKYQQNLYSEAVTHGEAGLIPMPNWEFRYDSDVTWKDVRLVLAHSYYLQGNFIACRDQLNLIDGGNRTTTDPLQLLDEILNLWTQV